MKFFQHTRIIKSTRTGSGTGTSKSYFIREVRDEHNNLIKYVYLDETPIGMMSKHYNEYEIFRREMNPKPSRYFDHTMFL